MMGPINLELITQLWEYQFIRYILIIVTLYSLTYCLLRWINCLLTESDASTKTSQFDNVKDLDNHDINKKKINKSHTDKLGKNSTSINSSEGNTHYIPGRNNFQSFDLSALPTVQVPEDVEHLARFFLQQSASLKTPIYWMSNGKRKDQTLVANNRTSVITLLQSSDIQICGSMHDQRLAYHKFGAGDHGMKFISCSLRITKSLIEFDTKSKSLWTTMKSITDQMTNLLINLKGDKIDARHLLTSVCLAVSSKVWFNHDLNIIDSQELSSMIHIQSQSNRKTELTFWNYLTNSFHKSEPISEDNNPWDKFITELIQNRSRGSDSDSIFLTSLYPVDQSKDDDVIKSSAQNLLRLSVLPVAEALIQCLAQLMSHQDIQCRVQAELDLVVDSKSGLVVEDLTRLHYTQAVVLETLRLHPPVPLVSQLATTTDCEVSGFKVPPKTPVILNILAAHLNSKLWSEPHEFKPERFLDYSGRVCGRDKILPFSLGIHSCPSRTTALHEIIIILVSLVHKFNVHSPDVCGDSTQISQQNYSTSNTAAAAVNMRFIPRPSTEDLYD